MGPGFIVNFRNRSNEPELIDGSDYEVDEYLDSLADLRRINRLLGGRRSLTHHLFPMILALGKNEVRLLDIGTGSADIPEEIVKWARQRGIRLSFVVLDINEIAAGEAHRLTSQYPEISVVRADALRLPFAEGCFDFVLASLFLHHFENFSAAGLLKSFARVASSALIINDIRRHPIAYYAIRVLTMIFTRNRLVRNDSAVSVLRGFTDRDIVEISRLSGMKIEINRHFPYRFILIGKTENHERRTDTQNI